MICDKKTSKLNFSRIYFQPTISRRNKNSKVNISLPLGSFECVKIRLPGSPLMGFPQSAFTVNYLFAQFLGAKQTDEMYIV